MLSALSVGIVAIIIGYAIGAIMLRGVNEQIKKHSEQNPIPQEGDDITDGEEFSRVGQAATG